MSSLETQARKVLDLVDLTVQSRTRREYEAARDEWLDRSIGFDVAYCGAALPEAPRTAPQVVGIPQRQLEHCEDQIDRYWPEIVTLNRAAERADGAVEDLEVLSAPLRDRSPFYREVVTQLGIRTAAISVLRIQRRMVGCLYLGRLSRGARFKDELGLLRAALPALSVGKQLFDAAPEPVRQAPGDVFTKREKEVLQHLVRGCTNKQISERLGSSPMTVKNQVAAMLVKAGVKNRAQLVYFATGEPLVLSLPGPSERRA